MTNMLTLKEKIVGFYKNYEYLVTIVGKFILAMLVFNYVNTELGFFESLTGTVPTLFLSGICAIVPVSVFVLIFALVVVLHLFKLSMMLSVIALIAFLIFYFVYLKFAPTQGILIILYPVLAQFNLHYMIPLIAAMAFNPFAAFPVAFGVIFVKIIEYVKEAASLGDPGMDVESVMTSYQYIFDNLLADKEMIAYFIVFTIVILIVYAISRLSINYSWYIAIGAGTVVNVIGLAMQTAGIEGVSIGMVVIGSVIGAVIAALGQFMGCTLDYTRKEFLQFEDDDYYYYVKAVPKIQVTQAERTVKSFGKDHKERKKIEKETKKSRKAEEEAEFEETLIQQYDDIVDSPNNSGTVKSDTQVFRVLDSVPEVKKQEVINDFDELSFDGFDFDDLDQK